MLKKQFCICKCYFEKNLYLKSCEMHFAFKNSTQFLDDYSEILKSRGFDNLNLIEEELKNEISRRKEQLNDSPRRKKLIRDMYIPLHSNIFTFSEQFFDPEFLTVCNSIKDGTDDDESLKFIEEHKGKLFSMPVFSHSFCDKFKEEIKHFENSSLPKQRPNTMNKYGVNVDELGFEEFISKLRTIYLNPLARLLFPEWVGSCLDSHKAFVVSYRRGEDIDLGYHYDNAEVTLNVSLNDDFSDGELYFGPMRFEDSSFRSGYVHSKGTGVVHRGQQMHGALPISDGERYNLIIWMRSSDVRNRLCPMCDEVPNLDPVSESVGDGFTQSVDNVCSTS